jgi:hypothetical protein
MHPSYIPIDADLLKRLYVDERLTAEAIAARLGCSPITILRRLRRFGIPARPRGPLPGQGARHRLCRRLDRNRREPVTKTVWVVIGVE